MLMIIPQNTCMAQSSTANICSSDALSTLTPCLTELCTAPVDIQPLVAGLNITWSPKRFSSCEQTLGAGSSQAGGVDDLPLNGSCSTSPYGFQTIATYTEPITASNGCKFEVYDDDDCLGDVATVDLDSGLGGCLRPHIIGKSTRLTCNNVIDGESPPTW